MSLKNRHAHNELGEMILYDGELHYTKFGNKSITSATKETLDGG